MAHVQVLNCLRKCESFRFRNSSMPPTGPTSKKPSDCPLAAKRCFLARTSFNKATSGTSVIDVDFNAASYLGGATRDRISFDERKYQVELNF